MLATFVGESFCERLVALLGLRELRAQGVDVAAADLASSPEARS
jgi:hypothetical protein